MKTMFNNKTNLPVSKLANALLAAFMLLALQAKPQSYCAPAMINSPQYEYISNVTFAGINHNSGTGSSTPVNYTAFQATVVPGTTYNASISGATPSGSYPEWYKIWIDWNQNGTLNDAGEFYDLGYSGVLPTVVSIAIPVPANALPGVTRMRVMMAGNASGNTTNYVGSNPCYSSVGYGEVDDYSVLVEGACSGINTPTLSIANATVCQGLAANINVSGSTPSLGVTYQWQQATSPAGPFTAGSSSSVLATQTPTIGSGVTYFMLVANCTSTLSSATASSNVIAITGGTIPPTPSATAMPTAGSCVGTSASLTAQSAVGATYSWVGPNGYSSALQSPTLTNVQLTASGVYTVYAFQNGCNSLAGTVSVNVAPNPTVNIQGSASQFCVGGAPVTLTVNSNGNTNMWNTGASTPTIAVSPTVTTPYNVIAQSTLGCFTQAFYTVTATNATLSVSGAWSCNNGPGGSGVLTAQAFTPSTVSWYASPTATTPILSASANSLGIATYSINNSYGDSTVYVIAKQGVCSTSMLAVTLTVSPQPTVTLVSSPTVNLSAPTITVCSNDNFTFTASGAATYTWYNGVSTVVSNSMAIVPSTYTFFSNSNSYTIAAASAAGCTGGTVVSLYVNQSPLVSTAAFANNICPGGSVTLYASGNANMYTWSANANNSTAPSVVVSPTVSGVYTVIGTALNGCTTAASQSITVNTPPTLSITAQRPKICSGESVSLTATGAVSYTWTASNFLLQGPAAFVSPNITTNYLVTGTGTNGCVGTATIAMVVNACTGIQQIAGNGLGIKVYPNPSNGEFTFELNNGAEKTVEITDPAGRLVMSSTSNQDVMTFNIDQLARGVYYLKVKTNNAVEVVKVVKQ